jgi:alpha-beta hydrolase superfamily lysophospholipase
MAHTLPWFRLTGRGLQIQASDNVEMLRALGRDPLFIKETRSDAIWGLSLLMQEALDAAPNLRAPTLLLYGDKDEVVRPDAFEELETRLAHSTRLARYPNGWHLLFRDLGREAVFKDALAWMLRPDAPLPSGLEQPLRPAIAAE